MRFHLPEHREIRLTDSRSNHIRSINVFKNITLNAFWVQVSVHRSAAYTQDRQVPNDKIDEFIYGETINWNKVAEKALEKGHLTLGHYYKR